MEIKRLHHLSSPLKLVLLLYFFLTSLGFCGAALMSYDRYHFDHQKTSYYYRGDPAEGETAFAKPFSQLIGVTHVHSYTMPLVFLTAWLALQATPIRKWMKNFLVLAGGLSILIYNIAPYVLRYETEKGAYLFTIGGVGLFVFFFCPALLICYEILIGLKED